MYDETKRDSASLISSGRIVSSAMFLLSSVLRRWPPAVGRSELPGDASLRVVESGGQRAVDHLVAEADPKAADDVGVDHHVELDVVAELRRQCCGEPVTLLLGQRHRGGDRGHLTLPAGGGSVGQRLEIGLQRVPRVAR